MSRPGAELPAAGPAAPERPPAGPPAREDRWDLPLRVVGGLLALVGGVAAGLLAVLLVPLRVADAADLPLGPLFDGLAGTGPGAVRLPVAVMVAVAGNLVLVWFAGSATQVRWGPLLPALGWAAVIWAATQITAEGDRLLLPDDWIGLLTLFGGTVVLVIGVVLGLTTPSGRTRPGARPARPRG